MYRMGSYAKAMATLLLIVIAASAYTAVTDPRVERTVVVYTSVDQVYSEPVFRRFQEETGITVKAVYDVEAAKTTGLVNRLIAEKGRPLCDVWWSGEIAQTILLGEEGALAPYSSPSAAGIPPQYVDPGWRWVGFGGRARVLLVNTELVGPGDVPESLLGLTDSAVPANMIGLAYPMFGTTATHAAALYAHLGPQETRAFFMGLRDAGVRVVDGNSVVRDLVAGGQLAMGLTDTDDAIGAVERSAPVEMVFLDQGPGGMGTLIIPNTVALVRGAPHPDEAKELIDYLLSERLEAEMVESGWLQLALRPLDAEPPYFDASGVKGMPVGWVDVYSFIEEAKKDMAEIFIR
jgi:iron(III) transport system substrate-binding protein